MDLVLVSTTLPEAKISWTTGRWPKCEAIQRGAPAVVWLVDVDSRVIQEQRHHFQVTLLTSSEERGGSCVRWFVDTDSQVSQEQRHHFLMTSLTSNEEGSGSGALWFVDLDSLVSQKQWHHFLVTLQTSPIKGSSEAFWISPVEINSWVICKALHKVKIPIGASFPQLLFLWFRHSKNK